MDKALAAFFYSLIALVSAFGVATDWATPDLINAGGVAIAAIVNGLIVWGVPNREKT